MKKIKTYIMRAKLNREVTNDELQDIIDKHAKLGYNLKDIKTYFYAMADPARIILIFEENTDKGDDMTAVGKFEKISEKQLNEYAAQTSEDITRLKKCWENIEKPTRATTGSCGYDFHVPYDIDLAPGETKTIPSFMRCFITDGWWLMLAPRSGLGFKYKLRLNNTVGVIDSDYYYAKNEGHILIRVTNEGNKQLHLNSGDGICQGIFVQYGITTDDDASGIREGGFGSTDKK